MEVNFLSIELGQSFLPRLARSTVLFPIRQKIIIGRKEEGFPKKFSR